MTNAIIKKFKLYFAWDESRGERWLEQMAREGWHFKSVTPLCNHTFARGEPAEVAYRIDILPKRDPHRDQLFQDAGWERVTECAGWQYWRKPGAVGRHAELFTDAASLARKYRRVLAVVAAITLPAMICLAKSGIREQAMQDIASGSVIAMSVLALCILAWGFNVYAMLRLTRRIVSLKKQDGVDGHLT